MPDLRFAELCGLIEREAPRLHIPGVALGILHGGETYTSGFGVTNVEHPLPVNEDTLFQIGSTTKTVTATAAMRLVEQGRLDLNVPVRTYIPELRLQDGDAAAHVTMRHLFSHTGGWLGDYFADFGNGDDALARMVAKMADLPQITPLGRYWSYNNAGFYLAGRVLEVVAGKPFEMLAKELVLDPLGMNMSFFTAAECITHRVAAGHEAVYEGQAGASSKTPKVARPWWIARTAVPAGSIVSTLRDQLTYAAFHVGDGRTPGGERILSPESLALMQQPYAPAANGEFSGVAWFIRDATGTRIVRHGGATNGQMSAFVLAPDRGFAITVLTNSDRGGELNMQVVRRAMAAFLGIEEKDPEPIAADAAQLREYEGYYVSPLNHVELKLHDGRLVMEQHPQGGFPTPDSPPGPAEPPMTAALSAHDWLVLLDEPEKGMRGEFMREEGEVRWLRFGGRMYRKKEEG